MPIKIATPISTLLNNCQSGHLTRVLNLSDALEIRDISQALISNLPRLYHSKFSILEKWSSREINYISSIINENQVKIASFHLPSCFAKPKIVNGFFSTNDNKLTKEKMLENAKINIKNLKLKIGKDITLAVENNNYYPSGAYEIVTEPEFINLLLDRINLSLVLDISHAEITAYNGKMNLNNYINKLNLAKVCQIHLSGAKRDKNLYLDKHRQLIKQDWSYFETILPICPNIKYVTVEYYKDIVKLISMLEKLKSYSI